MERTALKWDGEMVKFGTSRRPRAYVSGYRQKSSAKLHMSQDTHRTVVLSCICLRVQTGE